MEDALLGQLFSCPVNSLDCSENPGVPVNLHISKQLLQAEIRGFQPLNRMLKNPSSLSFRGAAGDEESRKSFVSRARFLASLGMTTFTDVFQHPARGGEGRVDSIPAALAALGERVL